METKIKIRLLLLSTVLIEVMSCKKDVPLIIDSPKNENCYAFENLPPLNYFSEERFQYKTPYFNPNDANEFVYNYRDNQLGEYKLMKYNMQTGLKTELVNNVKIVSQPKWSRKGWIAFDNIFNYQLWGLKDGGDSLTQFTSSSSNIFPAWNSTGDTIYWHIIGSPYYLLKQGLYSNIRDTVLKPNDSNFGYAAHNDISIDNKLLSETNINNKAHIGYTNLNPISFNSLINIQQNIPSLINLEGLCWSNNSQIAYFTIYNVGLFKIDVANGSYTKLMEFCNSKRYGDISCSSDGTKLIGERVDSYLEKNNEGNPTGKIIENSSIYLIDLQTLAETKINLE
jgi:hypothetical protein